MPIDFCRLKQLLLKMLSVPLNRSIRRAAEFSYQLEQGTSVLPDFFIYFSARSDERWYNRRESASKAEQMFTPEEPSAD